MPLSRRTSSATRSQGVAHRASAAAPARSCSGRRRSPRSAGSAPRRASPPHAACRTRPRSPRPGRSSARPPRGRRRARLRRRGPSRSGRRRRRRSRRGAAMLASRTSADGRCSPARRRAVEHEPASGPSTRSAPSGAIGHAGRSSLRPRRAGPAAGTVASSQRARPSMKPVAMCWTTRIGIGKVGGDAGEDVGEGVRTAGRGADPDHGACAARAGLAVRGAAAVQPGARMADHVHAAEQLDPAAKSDRGRAVGIAQVEIPPCGWRRARRRRARRRRARCRAPTCAERTRIGDRAGAHDLLDRLEPGHPGQLEVHRHEVGRELGQGGDRRLGGRRRRRRPRSRRRARACGERGGVGPRVVADEDCGSAPVITCRRAARRCRAAPAGRTLRLTM